LWVRTRYHLRSEPHGEVDERRIDDILAEIKIVAVELGKSRSFCGVDDG
jgi:hypothetical protein